MGARHRFEPTRLATFFNTSGPHRSFPMNAVFTPKVALRALSRNKLRSSLTALGLIIGVGAVVTLVGIGNGAKAQIESRVASLGQNVLQIKAGSSAKSASAVRQGAE